MPGYLETGVGDIEAASGGTCRVRQSESQQRGESGTLNMDHWGSGHR